MRNTTGKDVRELMTTLQRVCAKLPGSEEYVMVHHPAFRVGKKPFVILWIEEGATGASVSINLGLEAQVTLLDDERFSRTPYLGRHGWVTIKRERLRKDELAALVLESWRRVAGKKHLARLAH